MKVYIGSPKYWTWFHRFIAKYVSEKLAQTLYFDAIEKIVIDGHDAWSADYTLSKIAVPLLKELRRQKCGTPGMFIYGEFIEKHYPGIENEFDLPEEKQKVFFEKAHDEWKIVLDKIIWAHEQVADGEMTTYKDFYIDGKFEDSSLYEAFGLGKKAPVVNWDARLAYEERIQEGLELFGKYYRGLWS